MTLDEDVWALCRASAPLSSRQGPKRPRQSSIGLDPVRGHDHQEGRHAMDSAALRAMQAPLKDRYKYDPKAAFITLKAKGTLNDTQIACKVETGRALAIAGLHPATG